jgi:putative transcriptional regulator
MKKRNLFAELTEGLDALAAEREKKITLRKIKAEVPDALDVSPAEIKAVREASHASQAVMARSLHQRAHVSELGTRQGQARRTGRHASPTGRQTPRNASDAGNALTE